MEWKEFGIEEVARLCGIQMKNDGMGAREIKALCPFCSDKHYHLYLNTEKNQWNCFRCGAKGNDVSLYAKMNCITNREAVNELSERIGNSMPKKVKQAISTPMKSLIERHNVYYDMLKLFKLNNNHHKALLKRGLREDNIQQFMYKSLPETKYERRRIINALSAKYDLRGVRDFTVNTESGICIHLIAEDFLFQCAIKTDIYKVCKSDLILIKNGIGGFLLMSIRRGQVSPLGYIL